MNLEDRLQKMDRNTFGYGKLETKLLTRPVFKKEVLSDLLEMIPDGVDTDRYSCEDSEYSFMLGYIQACIEIQRSIRKYCA